MQMQSRPQARELHYGESPMNQAGLALLVLVGASLVLAPPAQAQSEAVKPTIAGTGAVTGTVTASRPFTAAQVYLRNADKAVTFMVYTVSGNYQAINLYP